MEVDQFCEEIIVACIGPDESPRVEALQSLASDPRIPQMLHIFCTFISAGVKRNVVKHELAFLIYLMRMVKALLDNQTLYLEKHLHQLIPSVASCIVSEQLCSPPDAYNHWALRDFASRLMAQICRNFHTSTCDVQTRVTRMFSRTLQNEKMPLTSHYGAICGLSELGPEVVRTFIVPRVNFIGTRVKQIMEGRNTSSVDKSAAQQIMALISRILVPILKTYPAPDNLEEYKSKYGYLGPFIHSEVVRSRQRATPMLTLTLPRIFTINIHDPTIVTSPRTI